jgi:hypothetical protein
MSDSITGEFSIKGAPDTFVSTMLFLFGGRDDLTVSPDNDQQHVVKITPNGPQPYYQWCRFEAFALQDGPTQIRYFTPNKSDMESTIGEVIATLKRRGFIVDDSPPATLEIPESEDQAGATSEIPKSDDAAQRAGPPPRPGDDGATWDDTFDWFHSVPRSVCRNLNELAKMIAQAPGTVRNRHAEYRAEHSDKMSSRE